MSIVIHQNDKIFIVPYGRLYMKLQKLLSYVRRAVEDYQMIEEGDNIAVGVSGGKDSQRRQRRTLRRERGKNHHQDGEAA